MTRTLAFLSLAALLASGGAATMLQGLGSLQVSVLPARTLGETGSSGLRVSIITAQRWAMAIVLSQASGRSANSIRMSGAGLNQCSGETRRRSGSDSNLPSAIASRASCASYLSGVGK